MEDFQLYTETINNKHAITVFEKDNKFIKRWLAKNNLFKKYEDIEWEEGITIKIKDKDVTIQTSFMGAHLLFDNVVLRNEIYNWMGKNNIEKRDYWAKQAPFIKKKILSDAIKEISLGIKLLKDWAYEYNSFYVGSMLNNADFSLFGYDRQNSSECELSSNPLFDNMLEKYGDELKEKDLFNLIDALCSNNKYLNCKASYTCIKILLKNQTPEIEDRVIVSFNAAMKNYDPGHRCFQNSLLDRFIDEIFPTFRVEAIVKLISDAHPALLREDRLIWCAKAALEKSPTGKQKTFLTGQLNKYSE